jgi:hypothetical protein
MKKTIVGIAILVAVVVSYVAVGPFITLRQIKSALQSQDTERLSENIDFPTLRQNLKEQLSAFIVKETASDMRDNPFGGLALALAPTLVEGMIDSFVTPSGLASLMQGNAPQGYANRGVEPPRMEPANEAGQPLKANVPGASPLSTEPARGKREPFEKASYTFDSISKFSVWLDWYEGGQVQLVLTRNGLNWRLTNIVLPDLFKRERIESNERSAIGSLRTVNVAEVTYYTEYNRGYSQSLAFLGPPSGVDSTTTTPSGYWGAPGTERAAWLIDWQLAAGSKDGYRFKYDPGEPDDRNGQIRAYTLHADPIQPGETGNCHYLTDQTGIIRVDARKEASASSPPIAWR